MKRLNKRLCFLLFLLLIVVFGVGIVYVVNKKMPIPAYPLTKETIATAMKECELPESLAIEENDVTPLSGWKTTSYTLRNQENEIYAGHCMGILCNEKDGIRGLGLNISTIDGDEALSIDELKQAVRFATILFGGFRNDTQVYNSLIKEVDTTKDFEWKKEICGNTCYIKYQADSQLKLVVSFATDRDAFYHY